jgi:VWFA-related protein
MKRPRVTLLLPLVALLAAPAGRAQTQAGQAPFLEQVEVEVVNVDVHVTDGSGRPVTGLGKGDFELLEDGKPVRITNFEALAGDRPARARQEPEAPRKAPAPFAPGQAAPAPAAGPAEEQRFHLVVYIDDFNLRPAHRAKALSALHKLVDGQLTPVDRVMLVTYDQGVHVRLSFTSDRAAIHAALDQIAGLASTHDLDSQRRSILNDVFEMREARKKRGDPCDAQIEQPIASFAESSRQEVLRSIRGLTLLVNSLAGVPGHKALLHVSDGLQLTPGEDLYEILSQLCGGATNGLKEAADQSSRYSEGSAGGGYDANRAALDAQRYSTAKDFQKLTAHANAQGVPFYTLQASGLQGSTAADAEFGLNERALQLPAVESIARANLRNSLSLMASETGGKTIFDANDPSPDLGAMRADFAAYYSLGFSPAHHGDGKEHRIEVKVKRAGLHLRYRKGYRDEPSLERAVNRTLATLLHGFEDNPIEITMTADAASPATPAQGNGVWQVPVRLRIPLWKLALLTREDTFEGKLRLLVLTRDEADHLSPVRQVEVPIHIPRLQALNALGQYYAYDLSLQLPAGPHRLAVAVRDEYGGTTSYLGKDLAVGGPAKVAR